MNREERGRGQLDVVSFGRKVSPDSDASHAGLGIKKGSITKILEGRFLPLGRQKRDSGSVAAISSFLPSFLFPTLATSARLLS